MNPDFLDILQAFSEHHVDFLVVGAFAVSIHAEPRTTGDLDLFVRPAPENAVRVLAALNAFGAPLHDLTADDLANEGTVFQIGVAPHRIDILTSIDGVTFAEAEAGRVVLDIDGLRVPFIGREALMRNKRASGREKDRLDLLLLEKYDA